MIVRDWHVQFSITNNISMHKRNTHHSKHASKWRIRTPDNCNNQSNWLHATLIQRKTMSAANICRTLQIELSFSRNNWIHVILFPRKFQALLLYQSIARGEIISEPIWFNNWKLLNERWRQELYNYELFKLLLVYQFNQLYIVWTGI
jgi:hypothetical protein